MKRLTIAIILSLILCSCATVKPETNLPSQNIYEPTVPGKTRVVFFNGSNKVLYADGSSLIGIKIDGKGVANINYNQYVQLDLTPGDYSLELSHFDAIIFRDKYNLPIKDEAMFIKVFNRPVSTQFKILPTKPSAFDTEFSPVF